MSAFGIDLCRLRKPSTPRPSAVKPSGYDGGPGVQLQCRLPNRLLISFLLFIMAKANETSSAEPVPNSYPPRAVWCECSKVFDDPFYMPDNTCVCGVEKHHYHCTTCKGIVQIG